IISSPRTAGTHAASPRLRLRLAPRPRDVLRLALPYRPDEVVPDEDQDGGEHNGLLGRACHTLGAVADVKAFVGAHPRDDHAERDGLPKAEHESVRKICKPSTIPVKAPVNKMISSERKPMKLMRSTNAQNVSGGVTIATTAPPRKAPNRPSELTRSIVQPPRRSSGRRTAGTV